MSVRNAPPVPDEPTAKHAVVLGHDTPESTDWPAAFGLATTDQLAPAGCSTSVTVRPAAFSYWPTAKHFVAVAQDTPASVALGGVGMTGDPVTFDQLVPFHRNWKPAIRPQDEVGPARHVRVRNDRPTRSVELLDHGAQDPGRAVRVLLRAARREAGRVTQARHAQQEGAVGAGRRSGSRRSTSSVRPTPRSAWSRGCRRHC